MYRLICLCCLALSACSTTPPPREVRCPKLEVPEELMRAPLPLETLPQH